MLRGHDNGQPYNSKSSSWEKFVSFKQRTRVSVTATEDNENSCTQPDVNGKETEESMYF